MAIIGEKLKKMRGQKFLTQKELADLADTTEQTICRAEAGKDISLRVMKRLAGALGVKPEKLLDQRTQVN